MMDFLNALTLHIAIAWWAVEPAVQTAMEWAGILACCLVIGSVCCRIDSMRAGTSAVGWALIYFGFGVYAMGTLLDQVRGHSIDWYDVVGSCAIVLYLFKTRRLWKHGAPKETDSQRADLDVRR